jgi:hypothetical protein
MKSWLRLEQTTTQLKAQKISKKYGVKYIGNTLDHHWRIERPFKSGIDAKFKN